MLSTEGFFFFFFQKKISLLQHAVAIDNEVPGSARLPFYESLLIGQETSVRFSYYFFRWSYQGRLNLLKM